MMNLHSFNMIQSKKPTRGELQLECAEADTQSTSLLLVVKGEELLEANEDKGLITTDEEHTRQERTSEESEERRGECSMLALNMFSLDLLGQ